MGFFVTDRFVKMEFALEKLFDAVFSVQYAYLCTYINCTFISLHVRIFSYFYKILSIRFALVIHYIFNSLYFGKHVETAIVIPFLPSHLNDCNWIHVMHCCVHRTAYVCTTYNNIEWRDSIPMKIQKQYGSIWIELNWIDWNPLRC